MVERDLHGGVLQDLVALAAALQLARMAADSDPADVKALLDGMSRDVGQALDETALLVQRIYPSTLESFGLPLLEARAAGLPIITGELDYVRDIVDPDETFDPNSPLSMARAVKRFLGRPERRLPADDAERFLERLLARE